MKTTHLNQQTNIDSLFTQLEQLCLAEYDIQVSANKMRDDPQYRQLVVLELSQLQDAKLSTLLQAIDSALKPTTSPTQAPATKQVTQPAKNRWLIAAGVLALTLVGAGSWFYTSQPTIKTANAEPTVKTSPVTASASVSVQPAAEPAIRQLPAELVLRVHGSNTVGEKLAPALLEAFFNSQQATELSWQQQGSAVENLLNLSLAAKPVAVQLHAHGSSTAFKDLATAKADVGMSSRRITADEVRKLQPALGDLSKIGNEHIVAMDGLAIIVNQNNSLKAISTETLAKIFSGEINRWSQLGGVDQPIVVLARDDQSGTYDTFKTLVLQKHGKTLSEQAQRFESSSELSVSVSQNEAAIGFIGLNYISYNKALAISEGADSMPIYPTRFTVSTEDYALSRRLYLYTPTAASQLAKDFAQFAISDEGQQLVEQTGLISQNIRVEQVFPAEGVPASYNNYARQGQRLSLNFRFNYGENELDNKGKRDLERLIRFMENNRGRRLVLMGFSDAVGAVAKNAELALRRAKAVERELNARGIAVVAVESYGELLPVANNDTDAGRERNRRVEVWVL
ncbi:phosphate ABC transporter substrate-binding protein, PhoT family [Arsukibacterium tuosuense]|uniref:Phosphate ABC transporter substrate-binding protein, PhoT family n=1 Tax=Arsukibacterium tuosuense TaxID=1323745 RepID=A0A285ITM2_9GAMM|nr:phosphate ABC transporter substrate-binding/OmpA family protein [Arsukibacterium tuosuense]SNY51370.1 phosphate ABC transporter substrate-binding protein, PhoT family [Arsukibacterium tuosuense]